MRKTWDVFSWWWQKFTLGKWKQAIPQGPDSELEHCQFKLINQCKSHGPALYQEWKWIYSTLLGRTANWCDKGYSLGSGNELRTIMPFTIDPVKMYIYLFLAPIALFPLVNHTKDFSTLLDFLNNWLLTVLINSIFWFLSSLLSDAWSIFKDTLCFKECALELGAQESVYCVGSAAQLSPALCDPLDCSPPDSSVYGTLQARILEWVTISSSRVSSPPRDQTWGSWGSCISRPIIYLPLSYLRNPVCVLDSTC